MNITIFQILGGWGAAFGGLTEKAGSAFGAAKTKMANSFSHQNLSDEAVKVRHETFLQPLILQAAIFTKIIAIIYKLFR